MRAFVSHRTEVVVKVTTKTARFIGHLDYQWECTDLILISFILLIYTQKVRSDIVDKRHRTIYSTQLYSLLCLQQQFVCTMSWRLIGLCSFAWQRWNSIKKDKYCGSAVFRLLTLISSTTQMTTCNVCNFNSSLIQHWGLQSMGLCDFLNDLEKVSALDVYLIISPDSK